ncbi:MAG: 30S ribosomal protein S17 [Acidobacteriota bacterium]|nr:MAG: 30S ribosomal protein S17 [Acidobacteriota bacterium]
MADREVRKSTKVGRVVSNAMEKSVVVAVDRLVKHPLYEKTIRRTSKFMAHDEENTCQVGDQVAIEESRPLSRRKRWVVREVLERAKG